MAEQKLNDAWELLEQNPYTSTLKISDEDRAIIAESVTDHILESIDIDCESCKQSLLRLQSEIDEIWEGLDGYSKQRFKNALRDTVFHIREIHLIAVQKLPPWPNSSHFEIERDRDKESGAKNETD